MFMYPFELIDDKKIDLCNQHHRDIVIQRNKELEKCIAEGLELSKVKMEVIFRVKLECKKCGTLLEEDDTETLDDIDVFDYEITRHFPTLKCTNIRCQTKYVYSELAENYKLRIPILTDKPKKQKK